MARNVRPALAVSDHGGIVRSPGGGLIPSRRWPRPSASGPWQMAQFDAYITAPAARASGEAKSPAGALGPASRSHPEMTSESVNRTRPAGSFRFPDHLVAMALYLVDDRCDELIQPGIDDG